MNDKSKKKGGDPLGAKTTGERQKALKERRKAEGLVRLELWVRPENRDAVKKFATKLMK